MSKLFVGAAGVAAASYCYSYVIPEELIVSLQAALRDFRIAREHDYKEMPEVMGLTSTPSPADDKTLAVWVTPQPDPFARECVLN
ncbi:hypothetical protein PC118_g21973 [Phytophthora cactorum]|uniref:Uncharacterized protein n=1 Tax=Phytophthora cactorum TaxID=29920 RepID=A0A8T1ALX0_9STRA|nr:hypothetical protein PC112_g22068 [Phytophthora cactorum]KAG2797969.1 hypothetical protein PC111_g21051 [Phytophthora cactorum]KAG2828434.1 hypothetical protein PC113_g21468 [Phytophthora cactorum]KAG2877186.1 hypothetical protein PC114_g23790 [Phytophthora cactorum]KAG2882416.1 hypothetical protein PC115_g21941 [Phytophthora cactorum]